MNLKFLSKRGEIANVSLKARLYRQTLRDLQNLQLQPKDKSKLQVVYNLSETHLAKKDKLAESISKLKIM